MEQLYDQYQHIRSMIIAASRRRKTRQSVSSQPREPTLKAWESRRGKPVSLSQRGYKPRHRNGPTNYER
jgi:hypothetical protein